GIPPDGELRPRQRRADARFAAEERRIGAGWRRVGADRFARAGENRSATRGEEKAGEQNEPYFHDNLLQLIDNQSRPTHPKWFEGVLGKLWASSAKDAMRVHFSSWTFDSAAHELRSGETIAHLSAKPLRLLEVLIDRRPAAVA